MNRALGITFAILAGLLAFALVRGAPPSLATAGETAPDRFSVERAREIQRAISTDGITTRALGTEGNARAREMLVRELEKRGWATETQSSFGCSRHGICGFVENIVARRAGRDPSASGVLVMAHYDSVPVSPGASDDGMGVATVLEVARALGASPPLRRPVVIALTDGEESGLLGAEAFAREHPIAKTLRSVVNIDARGSSGPSALFETSPNSAWLVDMASRELAHPVTSSLFFEVYRRMPNDTDFTIAKTFASGVNFANLARIEHYHSPLDDFENADARTLAQHGTQALAMVRAMGESSVAENPPQGDAVWFDVFSFFIVHWPVGWTLPLAVAAFALVLGQAITMRAFGSGRGGLLAGVAALVAAAFSSVAMGLALGATGAIVVPWVAYPAWALAAMHGCALAAGLAAGVVAARSSNPRAVWAGTWLLWCVLGVAVAGVAPGAAYLFVVPALVAGAVAWMPLPIASVIGASVAGALWLPLAKPIYDTLGFAVAPVVCITTTMLVSTLSPMLVTLPRRTMHVLGGAGALVVAAALIAAVVPPFSVSHPQRVNVVVRQDAPPGKNDDAVDANRGVHAAALETTSSRVFVEASWGPRAWGAPPPAMLAALGSPPSASASRATDGSTGAAASWPGARQAPFVEAAHVDVAPPEVDVIANTIEGDEHRVRLRVRARKSPATLLLAFDENSGAPTIDIRVHGIRALMPRGWLALRGVPDAGVEADIRSGSKNPIDMMVYALTSGVPSGSVGAAVVSARSALGGLAVPSQEGDLTVSTKRLRL